MNNVRVSNLLNPDLDDDENGKLTQLKFENARGTKQGYG